MSIPKKLVTVKPRSLLLIIVLITICIFLLHLQLSEKSRSSSASNKLSPTPANIYQAGYGSFKGTCPKYSFVKRGVMQPDGSFLNELNAEITNIVNGGWAISTPVEHTTLVPDKNTVYPGKKTFQVGDCVTITYISNYSGTLQRVFELKNVVY